MGYGTWNARLTGVPPSYGACGPMHSRCQWAPHRPQSRGATSPRRLRCKTRTQTRPCKRKLRLRQPRQAGAGGRRDAQRRGSKAEHAWVQGLKARRLTEEEAGTCF